MRTYQILIIDDEPIHHMVLEEHLLDQGYKVIHAIDGAQGLEMLSMNQPDLILLDITMPVMDGFQTLEAIRKEKKYSDIPVLFLTSQESPPLKVKGFDLGADDYITKPFDKDELLARIKAALRRVERYRKSESEYSNLGLVDLLQSMELGSKTAVISCENIQAKIFFEKGTMVHVIQDTFLGTEALTRIFLLENGAFLIKFEPIPETIPRKTGSLRSALVSVLANLELGTDPFVRESPRRHQVVDRLKEAISRMKSHLRIEGTMEGDLKDISLSDLLQSLHLGSKTACISLPDIDGEIYIQEGNLLLVRQGNFSGEDALIRIFLLEKGIFSITFDDLPAKIIEGPKPLMSVLMSIFAKVDEIRGICHRLKVESMRVIIDSNIPDFPELQQFSQKPPMTFIELIALMPNDIQHNLSILMKAAKKGKIKSIKKQS